MKTNAKPRIRQVVAGVGDPGFDGWGPPVQKAGSPIPPTALLAVTLLLSTTLAAAADTYYVDINSSNSIAPYVSWKTAATNIQDAVDAAGNGDTVLIGDGTYNITEQIVITNGLAVRSANGRDVTIINANEKCRVLFLDSSSGSISLEGLTVTGGNAEGGDPDGGGIKAVGSFPLRIFDCIVENNKASKNAGGIRASGKKNGDMSIVITNCIVRSNKAGIHGGGISCGSTFIIDSIINGNGCRDAGGGIITGRGTTVSRCMIFKNSAGRGGGVYLAPNSTLSESVIFGNETLKFVGGGVQGNPGEGNHRIVNCTIVDNRATTKGGGVNGCYVFNSIVYNNRAAEDNDIGSDCVLSNSCAGDPSHGNGNSEKNPKFMSAKEGDYRLLPNSPCIDAGSNIHTNQLTDLDGNPRIMDGDRDGEAVVDIGAYEFQVINVEIDIKPGSKSNSVNLKARGLLPVAILTTKSFDASTVNPSSVDFAGAAPARRMFQDVDEDGDLDLLLQFERRSLKLDEDSTRALLTGETKDHQPFIGTAAITVMR